jgi:hypothetical protein
MGRAKIGTTQHIYYSKSGISGQEILEQKGEFLRFA